VSVNVDIKELFAAGAHFGHKTSRWHPKMRTFIHSERGGMHVIDLVKTAEMIEPALDAVREIASKNRQILLVSTKRQAKEPIMKAAETTKMPYVVNRWLGGLLTNFKTISNRIKHLKNLEKRMESGELAQRYSKLEVQRYQEEIDALNEKFGGIKEMPSAPGALFVVDIVRDAIAVKEAKTLNIPVIALVDSNGDPSTVDYPIPANDDAIKTIELVLSYITQAIAEGRAQQVKAASGPVGAEKPIKQTSTAKKSQPSKKPSVAKADTKKPVTSKKITTKGKEKA